MSIARPMSTDPDQVASLLPWNETGRVAVAIPASEAFLGTSQFIALVGEERYPVSTFAVPVIRTIILGGGPCTLPYLEGHQLVRRLCSERAMRTVDGRLRVNDRKITPESYLGLWRDAMKHAITPANLAAKFGVRIRITLQAELAIARAARCGWKSSPFATFAGFEDAYGPRFVMKKLAGGVQGFELELDLREPHAARDALYAQTLAADNGEAVVAVQMSLAPTDKLAGAGGRQSLLFGEAQP